jgi:hypothetical protein
VSARWVTDPETGEQVLTQPRVNGASGALLPAAWAEASYPLLQLDTQQRILAVIDASERLVEQLRDAGQRAAEAEANWKAARARALLRLRDQDAQAGRRRTVEEREALALIENEGLLREFLAADREFSVLREANQAQDRMMGGLRTLAADHRPHVSEVRR